MSRIHGGSDGAGALAHDFSTNSNACGPCPQALAAVAAADAGSYPDPAYTALRRQLADFHAVEPARLLLAASASEFIFRITTLAARRGGGVWLPAHAYGDYAAAAEAHGLGVVDAPDKAALRWACEPSSPLGCAHEDLAAWATGEGLAVLDRAYEPLRLSGAPSLDGPQLDRCWQLSTPNKALGLTGVRAACVIAPVGSSAQVGLLEQLCPSWPVGAHGVAMLEAWTTDAVQRWLGTSLLTLREWKVRQIGLLTSLGWDCQASEANFFCATPLLPAGLTLAGALQALRDQGIKLRDTASFGLPGQVRLGVLRPASQDALHNAWQQLTKGKR
jgi:histidinol-phosphate aminotransferase